MRKSINKVIALAIGISVMSGSAIPALAADSATNSTSNVSAISTADTANFIYVQGKMKPILTLKDAINATIDNSEKLALQSKQIKLYEDKIDIQEAEDDFQNSDNDFPYDKLQVLLKQSKQQKEYLKDQISEDITKKYNDLVSKENALNKLKKQIEIKTKQISDSEFKKSLGMITSIDLDNAKIELQKLKNSETLKENQLKNSQDYFKILTDIDVTQYSLEQDQNYEAFRIDGSEDEYFDKVIEKYKKYDKKILELTKDNLKDNKVDKPDTSDAPKKDDFQKTITNDDGSTSEKFDEAGYEAASQEYLGKWQDFGTYLQNKYQYNSDLYTLNQSEKSLKDGLKQSYTSLLDMENSINIKKSNIKVNNKQLSIAKLKYDTGMITKTDYETQVISNDDLETDLRDTINSYNTLKNQIQKPWLLS